MNSTAFFIITLLFGWCGAHKFIQKKYGIGFLYLFTFGLFTVGWIIDCVRALLPLLRHDTDPPSTSSESSPQQLSGVALNRRLQIIEDCMSLITQTNNADVFFPRYDLLLKTLLEIGDYQTHAKWQECRQQSTRSFIIRCYNAALVRSDSMKTEKGKYNQFLKAYESIEKYRPALSDETTTFFEEKFGPKLYDVR